MSTNQTKSIFHAIIGHRLGRANGIYEVLEIRGGKIVRGFLRPFLRPFLGPFLRPFYGTLPVPVAYDPRGSLCYEEFSSGRLLVFWRDPKVTGNIPLRRVRAICEATFAFQHAFRATRMLMLLASLRIAVGSMRIYDLSA